MRLGAPAHMRGVGEHLFGADFEDHIRVGRDEDPGVGNLAQQWIEPRSVESVFNRIHPDQDAVESENLVAHSVCCVV